MYRAFHQTSVPAYGSAQTATTAIATAGPFHQYRGARNTHAAIKIAGQNFSATAIPRAPQDHAHLLESASSNASVTQNRTGASL